MKNAILLFVFAFLELCSCRKEFDPECQYIGDMCAIDPEHCIRKMHDQLVPCYGLYYGPGMLYDTRGDTPFWITVDDNSRQEYADDLTYTIYSKKARRVDWSIPYSLSIIPGCCGLTLRDSCILPKREPGEVQYVYMPMKDLSESRFCQFTLEESVGEFKACKNEDDGGCLEFVDGVARIRKVFIPLTTEALNLKTDYCFFEPPMEYVHALEDITEGADPSFLYDKEIGVGGSGDDIYVVTGTHGNTSCVLMKNVEAQDVRKLAEDHQTQNSKIVCFFVRAKEAMDKWIPTPACVRQQVVSQSGRFPTNKVIISAVVCSMLVAIIIILTSAYAHKSYRTKLKLKGIKFGSPMTGRTDALP